MPSVAAIIKNLEGDVLVGKKNTNSSSFLAGEWHIPGETIQSGETDEQALQRGIKEETGLDVKVVRQLCSSNDVRWYECISESRGAVAGSDLTSVQWVPKGAVYYKCSKKATFLWPQEIRDYFS